jgi:predicted Zn-dependent peptidase
MLHPTIAGDIDVNQTKIWVEKYFGEIKRGDAIPKMENKPLYYLLQKNSIMKIILQNCQ